MRLPKPMHKIAVRRPGFFLQASAFILLLTLGQCVQGATFSWTNGDTTGNWSSTSLITDWQSATVPNAAGAVVRYTHTGTASASGTVTLNMDATVGIIDHQSGVGGSTGVFTIQTDGTHKLTMDNTGGITNLFGNTNAAIISNGNNNTFNQTQVNSDIVIANTDLDIGSVAGGLLIGSAANSNSITATTNQNLNIRWNGTNAARPMTINASIGLLGSGTITLNHVGTGTAAGEVTTINGDIGAKVGSINQNTTQAALKLTGAGTNFAGAVNLQAGTLILGSATALGGSGSATGTGGTLTISNGTTLDSSAANLVLTTTNAVAVNGNFTFAGTQNLSMANDTFILGAAVTNFQLTTSANTLAIGTLNETTAGSNFTKLGTGTLAITGSSNYSGTTTISVGTLAASKAAALPNYGTAAQVTVANTATLAINYGGASDWTSTQVDSLLTQNGAGFASGSILGFDTTNLSGAYSSSITVSNLGLTKLGTNTLTLSGTSANTYTGTTTVAAGTLSLSKTAGVDAIAGNVTINYGGTLLLASSHQIVDSSVVSMGGGSGTGYFVLAGFNETIGGLSAADSASNLVVQNNQTSGPVASLLTIDNSTTYSFGGRMRDIGSGADATSKLGLTKNGVGMQTLQGANIIYTGATTINAGTLQLSGASAFASSVGFGVSSTGILQMAGATGTISGLSSVDATNNNAFVQNAAGTDNVLTITQAANTSFGGVIRDNLTSNKLGIAKAGAGTLILAGSNTHTGGSTVSAGILQFAKTAALPSSGVYSATGTGMLAINAGGTGEFTNVTSGAGSIGGFFSGASFAAGTAFGIDTTNAGGSLAYSGDFGGNPGITKLGTGTLTLSGSNSYTGATTVRAGTLAISGTLSAAVAAVTVGDTAATSAILNVLPGASISRGNLQVGTNATALGAVYQSGGSLTLTQAAAKTNIKLGSVANGYGYYKLSVGTLTTNEIGIGGADFNNSTGVMDITGGTFNSNGWVTIGRGSQATNGLLNVTGGSVSATRVEMNWAGTAGGVSMLNIGGGVGGASVSTTASTTLGLNLVNTSTTAGTLSVANLLANGTLTTGIVTASQANPTALLNFNGGTLKAATTNAGTSFMTSANIDGVYIYSGGATIDDNGTSITISRPLLAPTGKGVTAITTGTGTGYIGSPLVKITGGSGTGATGVANFDPATGQVTGVTITNPGYGYADGDALTVTFTGGGGSAPAVTGTTFTTNITVGGLTKSGSGTLTLSGANTFGGDTVINSGTLTVGNALALQNSTLNYNNQGGTLSFGSQTAATFGGLKGAQNLAVSGTSGAGVNLTVGGNNQSTTYSGVLSGSGSLTKTGNGLLVLSNSNTYIGGTTLASGTLRIDHATALNTATGTIKFSGGVLQYGTGINTDYSGRFSSANGSDMKIDTNGNDVIFGSQLIGTVGNTGSLTKLGAGSLTLNSTASKYVGATTISAGTLTVASLTNSGSSTSLGGGDNSAANLVLDGGTLKYTGASSGTTDRLFTLTENGGTLNASGANPVNFTGNGANLIDYSGSGTRTLTLTGTNTAENTLAPVLADGTGGTTSLTKSGSGTWVVTGSNTFTGGTTLASGTLVVGHNNALGTGLMTLDGGSLASYGDGWSVANNIAVTATTVGQITGDNITFTGMASGTAGTLNLNLSGTAKTMTVNRASDNGFAPGKIQVTQGTLVLGGSNVIGDSTRIDLAGGRFNTGGKDETVGALTLSGSSTIDFNNGSNTMRFASLTSDTSNTLALTNWTSGASHLVFTGDVSSYTSFLGGVSFNGSVGAQQIDFSGGGYELVPVPEPATIIGAFAFVGLIALRERRRFTALLKRTDATLDNSPHRNQS